MVLPRSIYYHPWIPSYQNRTVEGTMPCGRRLPGIIFPARELVELYLREVADRYIDLISCDSLRVHETTAQPLCTT